MPYSDKILPISIVVAALVIGGTLYFNKTNCQPCAGADGSALLTAQQAADKAIKYLNENVLQEQGVAASLAAVTEENTLYKVTFAIQGEEMSGYVSKDGSMLFPEGINLNPLPEKEAPKADVPDVKLFVMAYCPYGNQAEDAMYPVQKLLGNKANISLHYVLYSNYASGYPDYCLDESNVYCSMHGIGELNQGIRELCVYKYEKDKLWDFVAEANKSADSSNIDEKWEGIASTLGINVEKIKQCQAEEGLSLAKEEAGLTAREYDVQNSAAYNGQEKMSVSGSPTLIINGMVYDGPRTAEGYKQAICNATNNPSAECSQTLESASPSGTSGSCH